MSQRLVLLWQEGVAGIGINYWNIRNLSSILLEFQGLTGFSPLP